MNATATPTNADSLLREPTITERLGVSRSWWWAAVKAGKAPAGIKLSARVTVWRKSEIDSFIAQLGK